MKTTRILNTPWAAAALAVTALTLANPSAHAATVWNVNIGSQITTSDNFVGAAPENTVSSTWNSVTTPAITNQALVDSTGAASTATLTLGGGANQMGTYSYTILGFPEGPEIFRTWLKHDGNSQLVAVTFGGLSTSPGVTYDLIVYSGWVFDNGAAVPITQTVGTGLTGTVYVNNLLQSGGLVQDTNPANNTGSRGNWIRINGLTPNGGTLGFNMNGQNAALSGFQLVQVPEPSAALLGGLGLLALLRRRR